MNIKDSRFLESQILLIKDKYDMMYKVISDVNNKETSYLESPSGDDYRPPPPLMPVDVAMADLFLGGNRL